MNYEIVSLFLDLIALCVNTCQLMLPRFDICYFSSDEFNLDLRDLGQITKIKIRQENKGVWPSWLLKKVSNKYHAYFSIPALFLARIEYIR